MTEEEGWLNSIEMGVGAWAWGDRWFWGFGSNYQQKDVQEAYQASLDSGIRMVDTAETYGQGESERLIGKFIQNSEVKIYIATKFMPFPWKLGKGVLKKSLLGSLQRLGIEKADLYQMHWQIPPVSIETWMGRMAEVQQAGLVDKVGVSNYDRAQTQRAFEELTRLGVRLEANQVEYHLLDRRIEKSGLLKQCKELGIRVIAYSPLAQGLLTGKYSLQIPPRGVRGNRISKTTLTKLQGLMVQMRKIGALHGDKTPAQVALNWVICKGALPIPGAKNQAQAVQNAGAMGWRLGEDEIEMLDRAADKATE